MNDSRLQRKIEETKAIAGRRGLDLCGAPLLVTFDLPVWGVGPSVHEISGLARHPGIAVAATTAEALPPARRTIAAAPNLHILAERGLVAGLSAGATLHLYPTSAREMEAFAVALFTGIAPDGVRIALGANVSSGRQEATFEPPRTEPPPTGRELLHALRRCGGTGAPGGEGGERTLVIEDHPAELEALRAALSGPLAGRSVRATRMPSGRFVITPERPRQRVPDERIDVLAHEIAVASDRFLERRGGTCFGFATEPVARWEYGPEKGAHRLAAELFGRPDTVVTHLGLHPFQSEGSLFFAYDGSETIWEAANKGISFVPVRDVLEYCRILQAIRKGG